MGKPILKYEAGQVAQAFEQTTDSGDQTTYAASFSPISNKSGFEPTIAPYGVLTGGVATVDTGTNDSVTIAALTLKMPAATGADANGDISVSSGNLVALRGATTDTHRITSLTVDATGALAAVAGTDHTAFSETRGATGGPPYIPVGSVEIGQVRFTSITSADVDSAEIFQVVGTHQERSDFPVYASDYGAGEITFADALPTTHTAGVSKKVYIKGSTPLFSAVPNVSDWVAAKASYSVNSVDTYDGPVGSSSSSLGQGSFTFQAVDGISDALVKEESETLWFKYQPDRDSSFPLQYTQ
ncbi:MAG: hypothetical protein DRR06_20110, partial [Gammaproteobacteria bacterium]